MRLFLLSIVSAVILTAALHGCISSGRAKQAVISQMPDYNLKDDILNYDWYHEELITILGYTADVMEIGITHGGQYLLFNDRNDPDKDMHWAQRIDDTTYRYKGKVKNTVSRTVDGTPSFDASGRLYFITLKTYPRDIRTIYTAGFKNGAAVHPVPVDGNIYIAGRNKIGKELWVSIDPAISSDATLLFYSEGCVRPGVGFPYPFKIRGAQKVGERYVKIDDRILANINTGSMEYAPAVSADGLELFFTRISKVNNRLKMVGIYTARRSKVTEPFSRSEKIAAITGDVEAPVLSGDEKHLYYHRMVNGRYKAYRVTRKKR